MFCRSDGWTHCTQPSKDQYSLFFFLFTVLALLHAAEIAITTLYPWKVREFAEAEEKQNGNKGRGVFKILNEDITKVITLWI